MVDTIVWDQNCVKILDQTKLPGQEVYLQIDNHQDLIAAIKRMSIRGAPALGVSGAFGMVLGVLELGGSSPSDVVSYFKTVASRLIESRPTAVNLKWGVNRLLEKLVDSAHKDLGEVLKLALDEAQSIRAQDIELCQKLGDFGAELIQEGASVLTHCNTGGLATGGYGTALGVIESAVKRGKNIHVYVDETRPKLQGSRLTTWELKRCGIQYTLIADNMAGFLMSQGRVDCVIVGADRIAANGDTANKIGTYSLSVLAKHHNIDFYVAAPVTTFDAEIPDGTQIPIEFRDKDEVLRVGNVLLAPEDAQVYNPAFDITPASHITAIITDQGVFHGPVYNFENLDIIEA